ncbi:nucleoside phosphorylase domain-containing protein [Aspergillus avenaceus]|uniref:Nucleoside phosphorylase domain-containing protein n=1 Tax=Aspergillus avenaceus TaxID=36643 RepID=A0A5N6TZU8_ASPAV|nr:nucleoside phosphorylase domain-containing protein [Aspergillus avenaceus]
MGPNSRRDFTIAIICALPLEADAVEALFDETYDRLSRLYGRESGDTNAYVNGRIGGHNVVLCYMPGTGKSSAASVAARLRASYTSIQLALVVGTCGGTPYGPYSTQIFLGDVIISDAVIEYDFGKQYPGGFHRTTGVSNSLGPPNQEIRSLLAGLRAKRALQEFQGEMLQQLFTIQHSELQWRRPDFVDDVLFKASYHHRHYVPPSSPKCRCFNEALKM